MSLPRWVLGIDPGKTTGVFVVATRTDGTSAAFQMDQQAYGRYIEQWTVDGLGDAVVVCEAFVITMQTAKNSAAPWSLENIGIARYLCERDGVPFVVQGQSAAKNFATNDRLKALGWYRTGMPHAMDAARQVLLWLVDNGWWDERLSKP